MLCVSTVMEHRRVQGPVAARMGPDLCNTDNRLSVSTHGGWMLISVGMGVQLLLVAKNRAHLATGHRRDPI